MVERVQVHGHQFELEQTTGLLHKALPDFGKRPFKWGKAPYGDAKRLLSVHGI
jgi:hypothetical protein